MAGGVDHRQWDVGTVDVSYRARDSKLGRNVAIKVLPAVFAGDPQYMARFERETQVLASLNHANIGSKVPGNFIPQNYHTGVARAGGLHMGVGGDLTLHRI